MYACEYACMTVYVLVCVGVSVRGVCACMHVYVLMCVGVSVRGVCVHACMCVCTCLNQRWSNCPCKPPRLCPDNFLVVLYVILVCMHTIAMWAHSSKASTWCCHKSTLLYVNWRIVAYMCVCVGGGGGGGLGWEGGGCVCERVFVYDGEFVPCWRLSHA